jgi:hypothetical protein
VARKALEQTGSRLGWIEDIMRFYNDESTYAMTPEERLGPQSSDAVARAAVEYGLKPSDVVGARIELSSLSKKPRPRNIVHF